MLEIMLNTHAHEIAVVLAHCNFSLARAGRSEMLALAGTHAHTHCARAENAVAVLIAAGIYTRTQHYNRVLSKRTHTHAQTHIDRPAA